MPAASAVQLFSPNTSGTLKVPCGFHAPSGYDALRKDLAEKTQGCESIVYTGNFQKVSKAFLPQLKSAYSEKLGKVCNVIIMDRVAQERMLKSRLENWIVGVVDDLPFTSIAKSYKVLKVLGGQLWPPWVKRTLFMDASRFKPWLDLVAIFEAAYDKQDGKPLSLVAFRHPDQNRTIRKETVKATKRILGHGRAAVAPGAEQGLHIQALTYQMEGFDSNKLIESNVLMRDYRPEARDCTMLLECAWFGELDMFTYRDQTGFPYIMEKLDLWQHVAIRAHAEKKELFAMTLETNPGGA